MKRFRIEIIVALCAFVVGLALFLLSDNHFPNDDQFILLRYIDNIAFGKGFVFNEGEKILGATTPLFTLLAAFLKWIFQDVNTRTLVALLNIILFSGSAIFFYRLVREFISEKFAYIATGIFILNLSRVVLEGMESPLFILTTFGFLYFLLTKKYSTASVFLSLAMLTRPDAGLIAVFAFIYWLQHVGWEKTVRYTVLCIAVALQWLVWSTWYFGSFIPASLIAKTHVNEIIHQSSYQALKVQLASLSRIYWGKLYDPDNLKLQVLVNLLPFLALVGVGVKKYFNRTNWIMFAIPVTYLVAFSVSNPVMFPWYISQAEPLWILLSFMGFAVLWERWQEKFNIPALQIALLILLFVGPAFFYTRSLISEEKGSKWPLYEVAEYINTHKQDGDTVGVNNMGIIAYYTNNYLYDFFGLVNDYAYAFYRKREVCADQNAMYVIPPSLIMHTTPDWLVLSGEEELSDCFKKSRWFKNHYLFENKIAGASIWRLKK